MKLIPALLCALLITISGAIADPLDIGFYFTNFGAPTRIGSTDGPLAGSEIWGQMLVGLTIDALSPVPPAYPHGGAGAIRGPFVIVPDGQPNMLVYVQMAAWDSRLWGTSITAVPADQLGRTDITALRLWFYNATGRPPEDPEFRQPAIVPVPEPSAILLFAAGLTIIGSASCLRRARG